ncbi:MAG: FecR domain-containing protein [Prevotella sp.]|jgi:ferric-dicitrate binding protein FerR (iron transport regulator)|nr:FecR domain-containing protein [Prevotella sp.]
MTTDKNIKDILNKFTHGLYTKDDVEFLVDYLMKERPLPELSQEMDNVWGSLESVETSVEEQKEYLDDAQKLLYTLNSNKPKAKKVNLRRILSYAAALAIIAVSAWGIYMSRHFSDEVLYTEVRVDNGIHKNVVLPDGTEVMLNAGSYIKYPQRFAGDIRNIEIDGEAFFKVVRDETKPFVVYTDKASVKVLGTSFNVKSYNSDKQLTVSVKSGKVQVDTDDAMARLIANEQLVLDKATGEFQKRNEDAKFATAWISGGLYFNKTPIQNVVQELERMYNCKIKFQEGSTYDEYIYGEHDNKSLESVLKSIQHSTNIKYRKEGNLIILYK